jgi:hypothetical protein
MTCCSDAAAIRGHSQVGSTPSSARARSLPPRGATRVIARVSQVPDDPIPPLPLGPVQGLVGRAEQGRRVPVPFPVRGGRADGRGDAERGDAPSDALGDQARPIDRRLGEDDDELLPAEPDREVRAADALAEDPGDLAKDLVAGLVPAGVVEPLEVIEVDEEEGQRSRGASAPQELGREPSSRGSGGSAGP